MPLAGARRAARQPALPHDPGPRPCGRRALRHPRRRAGPLQGKGRLPLVAEVDHVGLITRMWYQAFLPREAEPGALAPAPLRRLAERLNDTPRRCLGYRTPREVFQEHLAAPDRAALTSPPHLSHFA